MSRSRHVAMIESVNFKEGHTLVAVEAEHAHEVGVLLITSEKLQFTVS